MSKQLHLPIPYMDIFSYRLLYSGVPFSQSARASKLLSFTLPDNCFACPNSTAPLLITRKYSYKIITKLTMMSPPTPK